MPGVPIIVIVGGTPPRTATTLPAPCGSIDNQSDDVAQVTYETPNNEGIVSVPAHSTYALPANATVTAIT